jgi:hypothetical protein
VLKECCAELELLLLGDALELLLGAALELLPTCTPEVLLTAVDEDEEEDVGLVAVTLQINVYS